MKCPYCGKEMVLGYIQGRDDVVWSERKRMVAALPSMNSNAIYLGENAEKGPFSGTAVEAYRCVECKKLIVDLEKKQG